MWWSGSRLWGCSVRSHCDRKIYTGWSWWLVYVWLIVLNAAFTIVRYISKTEIPKENIPILGWRWDQNPLKLQIRTHEWSRTFEGSVFGHQTVILWKIFFHSLLCEFNTLIYWLTLNMLYYTLIPQPLSASEWKHLHCTNSSHSMVAYRN